jgi:hypothetical protein
VRTMVFDVGKGLPDCLDQVICPHSVFSAKVTALSMN